MTKSTIGLGALGLGVTTAIATPLALKYSGGSGETIPESLEFQEPNWTGSIPKLNSPEDIKSIDCLKRKFTKEINWNNANSKPEAINEAFNYDPSKAKGCLMVDYYEQTYKQNKWWGEFKLVWLMTDEIQHGFITIVQAKTKNKQLSIDSAFYVLEVDTSDEWEVKYTKNKKKEIKDEQELAKFIPKPGSLITQGDYKEEEKYWGWFPQLSNMCGNRDCTTKDGKYKKSSSTWEISKGDNGESIANLFADLSGWFNNSFDLGNNIMSLSIYPKLTYEKKE